MNKENLYKLLDIEDPREFIYFENFASLIESDEDFNYDDLLEIFSKADLDSVSDIIETYFDDILDSLSSESMGLTSIFENEKKALIGLLRNGEESISHFVSELEKFREYFSINREVEIYDDNNEDKYMSSVLDALFTIREGKIDGSNHRYNFNNVLDYEIDEYIMSFSDLIDLEYMEDEK